MPTSLRCSPDQSYRPRRSIAAAAQTFRAIDVSGVSSAPLLKNPLIKVTGSQTTTHVSEPLRALCKHCPHGSALAVLPGFLFRFRCCGIFGVVIASKAAKNCASLRAFDRVAATFLGANQSPGSRRSRQRGPLSHSTDQSSHQLAHPLKGLRSYSAQNRFSLCGLVRSSFAPNS
jgi:hypothetical protein